MAISSAHILKRTARQVEPTQQLIIFRLRQQWFALPINVVEKVVPMGNVYGDMRSTGVSLTLYQDKELLVVDVGHRIFREAPNQDLSLSGSNSVQNQQDFNLQRYLLVVQNSQGELIGLPIDSSPTLRRVPESAFAPLPPAYISEANLHCVSSLVIQTLEEPPLFLLNPDQLLIVPNFINK